MRGDNWEIDEVTIGEKALGPSVLLSDSLHKLSSICPIGSRFLLLFVSGDVLT